MSQFVYAVSDGVKQGQPVLKMERAVLVKRGKVNWTIGGENGDYSTSLAFRCLRRIKPFQYPTTKAEAKQRFIDATRRMIENMKARIAQCEQHLILAESLDVTEDPVDA